MRSSTFTTYINAETDPGLEQAWARNTKLATASYGTITQAAIAATRATAGLVGGNKSTAGIQGVTRAIGDQGRAMRQTNTAAAEAERQSVRTSRAQQQQSESTRRLAGQHRNLAQSLNTTATAFSVVEGRMSPLAGRFVTVARAAEQLTGLQLGLAGVGATLFSLGKTGNEYAVLVSRLRPFYDSQVDANRAMSDIVGIAARSRTALEPIVEIYARLKSQTDQLGISQSRIGRLTEIASKAATLSGGTRQAREGALVQFSQAIGSNFRGSGQEFASLQEGAPLLLKAIADGYKNVDGSIGTTIANIRKLGEQGKLTSLDVADALDRSAVRINRQFADLPKTLGIAGTEFSNAFTVMVGRLDESLGLTKGLAEGISTVAVNLRAVTALIVGVAAGFAAVKLGGLISGAVSVVRQTAIMKEAVYQLGQRRAAVAAATQAQHAREVAALQAERAQIQQNIAIEQRRRNLAARDILRNTPVNGVGGSTRRIVAAQEEQSAALRRQIQEQQRLNVVNGALNAANGRLAASTAAAGAAAANATGRVSLLTAGMSRLRGAAGGLVSLFGGPWGIAFAAAATAVYLLATAQSAAERAAKRLSAAQEALGRYVDSTTGKIREQNVALMEGAALESDKRVKQAETDYRGARAEAANFRVLGNDPAVRAIQDRYGTRKIAAPTAASELIRLREKRPELADQINPIIQRLSNVVTIARSAVAEQAANRQLRGKGTSYDARIVENKGDLVAASRAERAANGGRAQPRSSAQIEAEAKARAARTDVQRAQAELAKIRADGRAATETEDQYIDRLAAAQMSVKSAQQAEAALRKQRTAGAAAARKEARDAIQDAKDEAAAKRDAALLELEKNKPSLGQGEFLTQRIAILKTYDDEVNKLDASAAASNRAAGQMIADAKKVAKAAQQAAEKRRDILSGYDDAPKAVDKARKDIASLQDFVDTAVDGVAFIGKTKDEIAEIAKMNPLGTGIYTQEMADADAANIERGLRKPMADIRQEADRNLELAKLQLAGADAEAEALRRVYQLVDQIGSARGEDYDEIVAIVRQEQRINDLLASRSRITNLIQGSVDAARDSFEQFITDIPNGADKAAKNFLNSMINRAVQIQARVLTEKIFGGADEKVRALISGKANVDSALRQYVETLGRTEQGTDRLATATERAAERIDAATKKLEGGGALGDGSVGTTAANIGAVVANTVAGGSAAVAGITAIASAAAGKAVSGAANDNGPAQGGEIVVTAQRALKVATETLKTGQAPSLREIYGTIGKNAGSKIDDALHGIFGSGKKNADGTYDTSKGGLLGLGNTKFFSKLGDAVGKGFSGAATGKVVGGLMSAIGIKTSQTGAQIGGAIGSFLPIPGGSIIGSIAGGLLGGLFMKTKKGSAAVTVNQYGEAGAGTAVGNDKGYKKAATGLAGAVGDQLNSIAEQLGGKLGNFSVSIGQRKKDFVVDPTGANRTKGPGVIKFKDEQEAIEYALRDALSDGAIKGISEASQRILKSGQDLQRALNKAMVIESIPKRLMQLTDPVRYAVTTLNEEFEKMINYLKEGGASAEQFAQAQKLYDLERAKAIEQASQQAQSAIQNFLNDMLGGSSSPLNKRTTYNNAAAQLDKFKADITAGKVVDQGELLSAARNFQDASRALNGSSSAFFSDFDMLRQLLEKARDNAGITQSDVSTLPASPFSESSVQAAIQGLGTATSQTYVQQTDRIVNSIWDLIRETKRQNELNAANVPASALAALGFK